MKLIIVEAAFPDADRAAALFQAQAKTVRAMEGCHGYALHRAEEAPGTIVIIQRWSSVEAFDAYRASSTFETLGKELKPLMTAPPVTTIANVHS